MARTIRLVALCLAVACALVACGREESWSQADRDALATVADRVAQGVGDVSFEAVDQATGITSAGAYAVVTVTPASPAGQSETPVVVFARNLSALGLPLELSTECIEPEAGVTTCHGSYGDVRFDGSAIRWSVSRGTILGAAG